MLKPQPDRDNRNQSRLTGQHLRKRGLYLAAALLLMGFFYWWAGRDGNDMEDLAYVDGRLVNVRLLTLPANRWVRIAPKLPDFIQKIPFNTVQDLVPLPGQNWSRQGHAGLAFDSKRDALLIFGSDSHGTNWDNSVHEFSPLNLTWTTHYLPSPKDSYRADEQGIAIAGDSGTYPWAMHTFDNIVYAPTIDALVVTSKIDHTPAPTAGAKNARLNPTWIYHLDTHRWEPLHQPESPSFFGAGSTYDAVTASVWAYKNGQLWRLDLLKGAWKKIPSSHHPDLNMHFTMTTDVLRHQFMFFGDYGNSNAIWVYTPAPNPDQEGSWEKRQPSGDPCPEAQHFPVAYDTVQGVFLLVPDESPERGVTLIYSPDDNRYIRVPGGEMPGNHMNYMMEYDAYHRVFLLVRGDWKSPVTVWAFRLDMKLLSAS
jgi:hypothetical protein